MESRYPRGLRKDELIDLVKVYNEIYSYFIKAINTGLIELVGLVFLFIFGRLYPPPTSHPESTAQM